MGWRILKWILPVNGSRGGRIPSVPLRLTLASYLSESLKPQAPNDRQSDCRIVSSVSPALFLAVQFVY